MSNVTGDGESFSSENNTCGEEVQQHQQQQQPPPPPVKKKRNLPGTPDPAAEVIALSPVTLMATNRFVCEVCNKGFQRDQNLQLHRRGHNLPWRLRQRATAEARKRVYVCPEPGCVHHDPGRALGDLTGIKKHFCRKHGEKKWRCDRCSKKYAVRSDWKAHSKTCGTREYRCDCGTVFSRRDSFITHRAFCDALAEETNNGGGGGGIKPPTPDAVATTTTGPTSISTSDFSYPRATNVMRGATQLAGSMLSPSAGRAAAPPTPNFFDVPSNNGGATSTAGGAHMSATALLQKAAQLGATASGQQHQQMAGPDMGLPYSSAPPMLYGDGSMYVNSSMIDGSLMMNHHHHQRGSVFQQQQHGGFITKNNLEVAQESGNNMTTTVDFMGLSGVIRPVSIPRSSGANTTPAAIHQQGSGIMHKSIWD